MSFIQPLALAGLLALAVPVLIHMMGRSPARLVRFPSLRFLSATRLIPTRRTKIHDVLLLTLRLAALLAAIVALAGPVFRSAAPPSAPDRYAAVLIDASLSGTTVAERARTVADSITNGSREASIAFTDIGASLAGSTAWLMTKSGQREIVVIARFRAGTVDSNAIAAIPHAIGVRLVRLGTARRPAALTAHSVQGGWGVVSRFTASAAGTKATWTRENDIVPPAPTPAPLAGSADVDAVVAARGAANVVGAGESVLGSSNVGVVFASYPARSTLLAQSSAVRNEADAFTVARVARSSLLAAAGETPTELMPRVEPGGRLLFFTNSAPSSESAAALFAALASGTHAPVRAALSDTATIDDATLASLSRPAKPDAASPARPAGESEGRWFWIIALAALAAEWVARRVTDRRSPMGEPHVAR